jgi:hypothetical protein
LPGIAEPELANWGALFSPVADKAAPAHFPEKLQGQDGNPEFSHIFTCLSDER